MRKIVSLSVPINGVIRLMVCTADGGAYLFLYMTEEDGPCKFDAWYPTLDAAERSAFDEFRIERNQWIRIDDLPPGCQQDWITPTIHDANGRYCSLGSS